MIADTVRVPVFCVPPLLDVQIAVYSVIVEPPLLAGAVNATVALPEACVTVPIVGAPGTVAATNDADAAEAGLVPNVFVAVIVQVYVLALVSAETVIGEVVPVPVFVTPKFDDVQVTSAAVIASPFVFTVYATIAEF